jgi:hypothetical protein
VRAISDANGDLFAAFDLKKGRLAQLLGPSAWWAGLRALRKGNFVGKPTGNETQMPGAFLVHNRTILYAHRANNAGDHPDLARVAALAASGTV